MLNSVSDPRPKPRARSSFCVSLAALCCCSGALAEEYTFIVAGLGGEPEYERRFREQAQALGEFAREAGSADRTFVLSGAEATAANVRRELSALATRMRATDSVTIVLLGHGSFDGEEYRFNLPGPDLTGAALVELFDRLPTPRQLIVNTTSASGAVAERWARAERVVITATKSGGERTATRFAQQWLRAVTSPAADRNKDDLVTAQEAFDFAERQVAASFEADTALATEHARMAGAAPAQFAVARFGAARASAGDAQVAALLTQRGALELELNAVKERRDALASEQYYDALESVLVKLALLQRQIDAKQAGLAGGGEG